MGKWQWVCVCERAGQGPSSSDTGPALFSFLQSLRAQSSGAQVWHLLSPVLSRGAHLPVSLRIVQWRQLPHPSPVLFTAFWHKETAHHLVYKVGLAHPTWVDLSKPMIVLFSPPPMPLMLSFLKTKQKNLCNYIAIYAFQGIFAYMIPVNPHRTFCSRCGIITPLFIDILKAQTYVVTRLSSHSKAKKKHMLAPRSLTWGEYSGPCLCQGASDL